MKATRFFMTMLLATLVWSPAHSQSPQGPSRLAFDAMLLGGFIDGEWVGYEDLQTEEKFSPYKILRRQPFKIYSSRGFEGNGTAMDVEEPGQGLNTLMLSVRTRNGELLESGSARLAIDCIWNPQPRQAQALPTQNANYQKIVQSYLAQNGLRNVTPNIVQLFRVDLEGDGVDEVVITAQNILKPAQKGFSWELDQPLNKDGIIPGGALKGNYSMVLVRKIVNGEVREIPLEQFVSLKNARPVDDEEWVVPPVHKIHQFADVDGDGTLEIIAGTARQIEAAQQKEEAKSDDVPKLQVVLEGREGFAVVRALSPMPSQADSARQAAAKLRCLAM